MPVQTAIKKKAGRRHVARVVREMYGEVPAFRVTFREKGRDPIIHVSDDGTLLTPEEVPPSLGRTLFGTKFEDTPAEVQEAIRREIGGGKILKIEKERRESETCYRVEFAKSPKGAGVVVVADTGKVLEGQYTQAPATTATASTD